MTATPGPGASGAESAGNQVLEIVRSLVVEARPAAPASAIHLDARLDRDLGLDSLAIVELAARLEDAFGVELSEEAVASAVTPRDLLAAIDEAGTGARPGDRTEPAEPLAPAAIRSLEQGRSLVEVLLWHADQHADRTHLRILAEGAVESVTYGELRDESAAMAAGLQARGLQPGQAVAIMLPTCRTYFTTFFGVLLAGGVPVPVYPPARAAQLEDHLRRHVRILDNAGAVTLLTVPEAHRVARLVAPQIPSLREVVVPEDLRGDPSDARLAAPDPHDVALIQYTSGSTGDPKGVTLTHANVLANIRGIGSAGQATSTDVFVSWLPLYHDMGLIGAWLTSLRFGFPIVIMSPLSFLTRPARWLRAIHDHGGTLSGGPNFGYELCLRRIDDEELEGVSLASWRVAFNGAEPVSADTVNRFVKRFARFGFRREALLPVYGLAECAVALTVPPLDRGPRIDRVAREALVRHGRAEPAGDAVEHPARFAACGAPLPEHDVRIVDERGRQLPERRQGRIQFRGPSATSGYFHNPRATRELFDGDWLETGDLGYLAEGELFVTGRSKDLIIRAGRNLHPAELEEAVGEVAGIRKGCVAAFASTDPGGGTERLVIVAETRETDDEARVPLHRAVLAAAADLAGAPPDEVVLAPPGAVPKTSSGKIRRAATRERYETGRLDARGVAVWRQVARLGLRSGFVRAGRLRRQATAAAYGLYARAVFALVGAPTWALAFVVPGLERRWALVRRAGALVLRLCGIRVTMEGLSRLPDRPYVVVANHASYIDPLFIAFAVQAPVVFAAIEGVTERTLVAAFVRRLGGQFVGGGDRRTTSATGPFEEAVHDGAVVAFFPEGRRTATPGLLPFRSGAFVVAADTGAPVVPLTIQGTRRLLPVDRVLPRRAAVHVTVAEPVTAQATGWQGAAELRRAARDAILRDLGEPDLA